VRYRLRPSPFAGTVPGTFAEQGYAEATPPGAPRDQQPFGYFRNSPWVQTARTGRSRKRKNRHHKYRHGYGSVVIAPTDRAWHCAPAQRSRRSSGVEHTLGKGGVGRSIRPGGTIENPGKPCVSDDHPIGANPPVCGTVRQHVGTVGENVGEPVPPTFPSISQNKQPRVGANRQRGGIVTLIGGARENPSRLVIKPPRPQLSKR
jgi:hypothetical protein